MSGIVVTQWIEKRKGRQQADAKSDGAEEKLEESV